MEETLKEDLLEGIKAICEFTGHKPRRAFYLAETGRLPAFKWGGKWCARKSTLLAHVAKLEKGDEAA